MRARHPLVHLGNHHPGRARRGQRAVHRRPQAHESVLVRRRHLHQHHVQRHGPAHKQAFNLAQEDGRVVGASRPHRFAHILAQEQSAMTKNSCVLRPGIHRLAQRLHVHDLDVAQFRSPRHQRIQQGRRRAAPGLDPYSRPGTHRPQRLRGIHALVLVILAPVHLRLPPRASAHPSQTAIPWLPIAPFPALDATESLCFAVPLARFSFPLSTGTFPLKSPNDFTP